MKGKFLRFKMLVIPILTFVLLLTQLVGCGPAVDKSLLGMINDGDSIFIEVANPSYTIDIQGNQSDKLTWVQLDRLKTYNNGFRQDFDKIFNINIITENGQPGKNGCLFVGEDGHRNGNTTLEDALRSKVFVKKYWSDDKVQRQISEISSDAYVDMDSNQYRIAASLNAYYNLLTDNINPAAFNPTQSLTREQFMSLVFRSEEGVQEISIDKDFEEAIGGSTEYSEYAQGVNGYAFLNTDNKSLDEILVSSSITRVEAVYLLVNKHFPEELKKVTGKEVAYTDTKNAGDLAKKVSFKDKEGNGKERWQAFTLAYMLKHPDTGLQEELYKVMVVAKELGLIEGKESRWDEPISKSEAIQLIVNTHLAKNDLYGFLSEAEYGEMEIGRVGATEGNQKPIDTTKVTGTDENGLKQGDGWTETPPGLNPADPNKELPSGFTLGEAKELVDWMMEELGVGMDDPRIKGTLKDLETTADELNSIQPEQMVQKPEETAKPVEPNKPATKPTSPPAGNGSNGTDENEGTGDSGYEGDDPGAGSLTGNSRSDIPPEDDKNGDGVPDTLEKYYFDAGPSGYDGNDPGEGSLK